MSRQYQAHQLDLIFLGLDKPNIFGVSNLERSQEESKKISGLTLHFFCSKPQSIKSLDFQIHQAIVNILLSENEYHTPVTNTIKMGCL